MIQRNRLALYTFLAVFVSILVVGGLLMPLALDSIQRTYLALQADVNTRQAKAMAQFIESRYRQGSPKDEILRDFQATILGSDVERGFVCLVDQATTNFLCHPMPGIVGKNVSARKAVYDVTFSRTDLVPWEVSIKNPQSTSGLLIFDNLKSEEVVHSEVLPDLGWVVNSHENTQRIHKEIDQIRLYLVVGSAVFALLLAFPISISVRTVGRRYEKQIELEQQKSDQLLLAILPPAIAQRMKNGEQGIVSHFDHVGIMFCDIVGFTQYSSKTTPQKLVKLLNHLFSKFDALCQEHGVEKIKTIGDAYMAVCGLPTPHDQPVKPLVLMGFEMLDFVASLNLNVRVRIGIHLGEVVAGVIGASKFSYDLWGDTVNTAARLESSGVPGQIHVSSEVKEALGDEFTFVDQGEKTLKGKGNVRTWIVEKKA